MLLIASGLTGGRGGETLFADLTFSIGTGEALIVTGPNGVGKSTLLRMVAGLLAPDGGEIRAESLPEGAETIGEACHYLGHRNGMKRELTVRENLDFWAALPGLPGGISVDEAVARVGLPQLLHLPFGYLSAGQQRRIAIARLLVAWRPIWMLDEPTGALDTRSEAMFAGLVNAHLDAGGLALIATHQPLNIRSARSLELEPLAQDAARLEWTH
jgi:heme exporter protein A